jgi:O-antigen/teichoic acid export membrane protein
MERERSYVYLSWICIAMNLARRSITSSTYNIAANIISTMVNLGGSIVLARLLEPEVFGVYAFAVSIVQITQTLPDFGLLGAFLNISGASEREDTRRVHFTLNVLLSAAWAIVLAAGVALLAPADTRWVFWIVIGATFTSRLTNTPRAVLVRRVQFRRQAALQIVRAVATTVVSIGLAWCGLGLWCLLAARIVAAIVNVVAFYGIRPVWHPRLGWSPPIVRFFLKFGSKVFVSGVLLHALDRVDDIWTGAVLGDAALGFYNRAYKFAIHPRGLLAHPLNMVVAGTYARLKGDRSRLSQAFFWANALMIRINFLLAGLLALVAPDLIRLVLGAKWLPMLDAFRLMLVYSLLDPIKATTAMVISICGAPQRVLRARLIQLVIMIAGLIALGPWLGIAGVALAVDLMLVVGMGILFWEARAFVDFSLKRMLSIPTLALVLGMAAAHAAAIHTPGLDWYTGVVKAGVFSALYAGTVLVLERDQIPKLWGIFRQLRPKRRAAV